MDSSEELRNACEIAAEAGELAASYFRSERIGARLKGWRDVVTSADVAAESLLTQRIKDRFGGDGVVAEEGTEVASETGRSWYLDPVDGTLNFSRGLPLWCVSMTLFDGEGPLLGVIRDPTRDETFSAYRASGAWRNTERLHVSGMQSLDDALVHVTVDFQERSMQQGLDDLSRLAPRVLRTRNFGSAALGLAYVAAGHFDALLHRHAHAWDYGAGVLLVQEAGGSVTNMDGQPYSKETVALVAAATPSLNGAIREVLLK